MQRSGEQEIDALDVPGKPPSRNPWKTSKQFRSTAPITRLSKRTALEQIVGG